VGSGGSFRPVLSWSMAGSRTVGATDLSFFFLDALKEEDLLSSGLAATGFLETAADFEGLDMGGDLGCVGK
jgi:hypothetical protein